MALHYLRFLRGGGTPVAIERWIAGFLPAYTLWSALVACGFPLLFQFA